VRRGVLITIFVAVAVGVAGLILLPNGLNGTSSTAGDSSNVITPSGEPQGQRAMADATLSLRRVSSPTPNTVRFSGDLAAPEATVELTSDGQLLGTTTITARPDGSFDVDVAGFDPGPQEVCLGQVCARVLVADPTTEDPAVIEARILEAIEVTETHFDFDRYLADWTIEITGQNTGTGGTASIENKQLRINANSGRSLDDYVITILHEAGHAVDADYLDEDARDAFRSLREHAGDLPWGGRGHTSDSVDRWADSAEDFAEVFVAWVLGGDYVTQSTVVAPQPTDQQLQAFCELLNLEGAACS